MEASRALQEGLRSSASVGGEISTTSLERERVVSASVEKRSFSYINGVLVVLGVVNVVLWSYIYLTSK